MHDSLYAITAENKRVIDILPVACLLYRF